VYGGGEEKVVILCVQTRTSGGAGQWATSEDIIAGDQAGLLAQANSSHCPRSVGINTTAGIFKEAKGLGNEDEEGYRTGPPGYIGWRNSFLGIDSVAPYTFKNTSSVLGLIPLPGAVGPW